ncbi:hypothetical protein [Bacillus altitudinis]|uniref:hypothetical protein n=1 Tax=Bacillus altitudinis TaxID=293387 RepID=UPI0035D56021
MHFINGGYSIQHWDVNGDKFDLAVSGAKMCEVNANDQIDIKVTAGRGIPYRACLRRMNNNWVVARANDSIQFRFLGGNDVIVTCSGL